MIAAYVAAFGFQAYIFRFVSILGERYTHGHVFDFYQQLRAHPGRLDVLGNGLQRKSYLYVQDCVSAILLAAESASAPVNIFNLGTDEYCQVNDSIGWITAALGLSPELRYAGGERGWVGDSPFIFLDCSRIRSLGWKPELDHRTGHHPHPGISARQSLGSGETPVKPLKREVAFATPWFDILAKTMREGEAPYYSLRLPDYASLLALTARGPRGGCPSIPACGGAVHARIAQRTGGSWRNAGRGRKPGNAGGDRIPGRRG